MTPARRGQAPAARGEALDLREDRLVARVEAEGLDVGVEGAREVAEAVLPEAGEVAEEADLVGRQVGRLDAEPEEPRELRVVVDALVGLLEHVDHVGADGGGRQEPLEAGERLGLRRAPLHHVAVRREGARGVVEVALARVAHPHLEVVEEARVGGDGHAPLEHLDELGPLAGLRVDGVEGREHRVVVARDVERLAVVARGPRAVREPLHRQLGRAHRQVAAHGGVVGVDRLGLEHRDELLPAREGRGEALELVADRAVVGALVERAAVGVEGRGRVAAARLVDLREAAELGEARGRVVDPRDLELEHRDEVVPARGVAEDGLQDLDRGGPLVGVVREAAHGHDRLLARRVDREHLAPGLQRPVGVVEVGREEVAEAQEERRARAVVGGEGHLGAEVLLQVRPERLLLVEALQREDGRPVGGRVVEAAAVRVDRLLRVAQVGLPEAPEAERGLPSHLGVALDREPLRQDAGELGGVAGARVEPVEGLEREDVRGVDVERAAEGRDGQRRVAQHVALRVADRVEEALAVLVVERPGHLALEHLDVARPVGQEHVEVLQQVEHVELAVVEREQAVVGVDRRARVVPVLVVGLRHRAQEVGPGRDVVGLREGGLVGLHEAVPERVLGREALDGLARLAVARVAGEGLAVGREGPVDVPRAGVLDRPDLAQELGPVDPVGGGREAHAEDGHELPPVVGLAVEGLEDLHHLEAELGLVVGDLLEGRHRVAPVAPLVQDLAEGVDAALRVAQPLDPQPPEAVPQVGALVARHRVGDALLQQLGEVGPLLGAREEGVEGGHGARVGGVDLEDLAVVRDGPRRVVEGRLVDRGDLEEVALARLDVVGPVGRLAVEREELAVRVLAREEGLDGAEDLLAGGVEGQRAAVVRPRPRRVAHPLVEEPRRLERQLRRHLVVARRLLEGRRVDLRQPVPPAEARGDAGHRGPRLAVAELLAEHARVGLERAVEVAEALLIERAEARQELLAGDHVVLGRDARLEGADELRVVAAREVDRLEHRRGAGGVARAPPEGLQGLHRRAVVGRLVEHVAEVVERPVGVVEVVHRHAAEAVVQVGAVGVGQRELRLQQLGQVAPAPLGGVDPLERRRRLAVEAHRHDGLVRLRGRRAVAELALRHPGLLAQERAAGLVGRREVGLAPEHGEELGVLAALLVERLEGVQGGLVVGPLVQGLLVVRPRARPVVEVAPRQLGHLHQHRDLQLRVEQLGRRVLEGRGEVGVALGGGREGLHLVDAAGDVGLGQRLPQLARGVAEGAARVVHPDLADVRGAGKGAAALLGVVGVGGDPLEHPDELLPRLLGLEHRVEGARRREAHAGLALREEGLERGAGDGLRGVELEGVLVALDGAREARRCGGAGARRSARRARGGRRHRWRRRGPARARRAGRPSGRRPRRASPATRGSRGRARSWRARRCRGRRPPGRSPMRPSSTRAARTWRDFCSAAVSASSASRRSVATRSPHASVLW